MKNLVIVGGMLSLWLFVGISLDAKIPRIPEETESPIVVIEPNADLIEYRLEQEELINTDRHWVNRYPRIYDIPMEGKLQHHIKDLCDRHNVDMEIVLAIIETESHYEKDAISKDGSAYGLMQIIVTCHKDRMARLGVTNILDPYQNVEVGIDVLSYLGKTYGTDDIEYLLMCYNMGEGGAKAARGKGVIATKYVKEILEAKEEIAELKFSDDTQASECNQQQRIQATVQ